MDFEKIFNNFAILGLFVFAFLAFIITLQVDNDSRINLGDDTTLNKSYNDIASSLQSYKDKAETQKELFDSEKPTTTFGTFLFFSIISAGKVFGNMIFGMFNILIKLPVVFLGIPLEVVSIISTILIITIIFALWVKYKLG